MVISMKYQVNLMVQTQEIGRNPSGPNLPRHACRLRSKISFHEKKWRKFSKCRLLPRCTEQNFQSVRISVF